VLPIAAECRWSLLLLSLLLSAATGAGALADVPAWFPEVTRLLESDPAPGPESGRITGSTSRVCALLLPARLRSVVGEGPAPQFHHRCRVCIGYAAVHVDTP
jgi:hypothetical protein